MSTKSTRKAVPVAKRPAASGPAKSVRRPAAKAPPPKVPATRTSTKQAQLIAMLRSPAGGTIEQITDLTGWQAHSVRGTISGTLRKRLKLNVTCTEHVYRIAEARA